MRWLNGNVKTAPPDVNNTSETSLWMEEGGWVCGWQREKKKIVTFITESIPSDWRVLEDRGKGVGRGLDQGEGDRTRE